MNTASVPLGSSENAKYIRITNHGKMNSWISHCLTFFEDDGDQSITLHTLPLSINANSVLTENKTIDQQSAATAASTIPRLISVVEIIKREYLKALEAKRSSRMHGLYQYNEVGTLQKLGIAVAPTVDGGTDVSAEDVRSFNIMKAVNGRNYPRQAQSPFMRITLSTVERPDLINRGATFQIPSVWSLSKSAKARAKKKLRLNKHTDMLTIPT